MQVIYEVREDENRQEKLYPIATAFNNIDAINNVRSLNKRLEANRDIFGGLSIKLRNRFNGNVGMFTDKEHALYKKLEHVDRIKEYRSEYIDDKRIQKYNPMETANLEPTLKVESAAKKIDEIKAPKKRATKKTTKK